MNALQETNERPYMARLTKVEFENSKIRIFRGDSTQQLDASGGPADPEKWYFEPSDYDGDVLWSVAHGSYADAFHASGCSVEAEPAYAPQESVERPSVPGTQMVLTLKAEANYGYGGKQYIARILGRDSKFTFRREFVGTKSGKRREYASFDTDEPGLYITCDITRKGDKDETYYALVHYRGNLRRGELTKEEAMKIARGLDAGSPLDSLLTITEQEGATRNGLPLIRVDAK